MNTAGKIIFGALMAIIIWLFIRGCTFERKLERCLNAPVVTDTVMMSDTVYDTIHLTYTYKVLDTVEITGPVELREYNGKFENDAISLRWRAVIMGEMRSFTILPPSIYRYPQITSTRTVNIARPGFNNSVNYEKSHVYFMALYTSVNSLSTSLMYINKRGWGVVGGATIYDEKLYWNAGMMFKLL